MWACAGLAGGPNWVHTHVLLSRRVGIAMDINEISRDCPYEPHTANSGKDDRQAGINFLKVCVGHKQGEAVANLLYGSRRQLFANRLILGAVPYT